MFGVSPLVDRAALEGAIKTCTSPIVLHLPTHGFFLTDESVASNAQTPHSERALDPIDTELAVLSACDTGLGQIRPGEGVFGLRRAFVVAGVRTLVVSLWKVPDEQTREVMVEFHEHVMKGASVSLALWMAQRTLRRTYPPRGPCPAS